MSTTDLSVMFTATHARISGVFVCNI